MTKSSVILIFLCSLFFLSIAQNNYKTAIAEKGEGIWTLLRRNGLDPSKNIEAFRKLNKTLLDKNNGALVFREVYLLPIEIPGTEYKISTGDTLSTPQKTEQTNLVINEIKQENRKQRNKPVSTIENKPNSYVENFQNNMIDVQLIDNEVKELNPGSSSNIVIMLINKWQFAKEIQLKIRVPESWSLLTDYSSVMIGKNSKKIKVLSFYLKELTMVGPDTVYVEVFNKDNGSVIKSLNIPVYIQPRYELDLEVLSSPEYVFAGDSLYVNFRLRNLSNTNVTINTSIINEALSENTAIIFEPNSYKYIKVPVSTKKNTLYNTKKSISLTASILDHPEISMTKSHAFDIIPSENVKFDAFNRIPIKLGGMAVTDNRMGERRYGYMLNMSAKGLISEKNNRFIELNLRKPDQEGNPIFGLNEEYFANYSSDHLNIIIGDYNFKLSDLTEASRYGRGVGFENKHKNFMIGGFLNYPKYYPDISQVYSVYSSVNLSKTMIFNAGYLNKKLVNDSIVQLYTIASTAELFKWARLEMEYAIGIKNENTSSAYKANLRMGGSLLRSYFNFTMADPEFPGYFSNTKYLAAGLSSTIIPKSTISASYELNHINTALDTLYANAPLSTNLSFSSIFRIGKVHNIGLAFFLRKREDRLEPKLFNYEEMTGRLTVQNKIGKFELKAYGEVGKIKNLLEMKEGEMTTVYKSFLSLLYQINHNFSLDVFANYYGGQYYLSSNLNNVYYGASVNGMIKNKLSLAIEYQNNYTIEEYYRDRSLLASKINYQINKNNELAISANYNLSKNSLNNKEFNVIFSYFHTINLPISKKKNIGSLRGRILNKGIDNVANIKLSINGKMVLTDHDGFFEFPNIQSGEHYLIMDESNIGLGSIAEIPGPYKIEILPGKTLEFEIGITKAARITGQIIIQEDANKDDKNYVPVKEQLGNLIIEITKDKELFRVFTSKDGFFNFDDLRTGTWQLKVYENGIPPGYRLITNQFKIDLMSGEIKPIEIFIEKKSRKIKFQKKF